MESFFLGHLALELLMHMLELLLDVVALVVGRLEQSLVFFHLHDAWVLRNAVVDDILFQLLVVKEELVPILLQLCFHCFDLGHLLPRSLLLGPRLQRGVCTSFLR